MKKDEILDSCDIEFAIASHFGWRTHIIVPNVSWGMGFKYELDLMILTKANIAYEIEIKTCVSDVRRDLKKRHQHDSKRITRCYFAIPEYIYGDAVKNLIDNRFGIFTVSCKNGVFRVNLVRSENK
jgi:hypothetical protein